MIKQADKNNISNISQLLYNACDDIAHILSGESKKDKVLETLDSYITMDICRLSYKNIWVYEIQNKKAGVILAYDSNIVEELDKPILAHLASKNIFIDAFDKECFADEYYIDTLSVFSEFQGRGIATQLLAYIEKHAKELAYKKLSLLVDAQNKKALRLYEKTGFKHNTSKKVSNQTYLHMIKVLK